VVRGEAPAEDDFDFSKITNLVHNALFTCNFDSDFAFTLGMIVLTRLGSIASEGKPEKVGLSLPTIFHFNHWYS